MEPLTAVGLVANIVQFVDLGCKIFASAKEIQHSTAGLTTDDQRTSDMMTEMYRLSLHLESPGREPSDANEKALFKLAAECHKLSVQILELMDKTSAKNPGSKSEAIRSTVRKMSANTKTQLISLATTAESQVKTIKTLDANLAGLRDKLSTLSSRDPDLLERIREIVQLPQAAREAVAQQQILRSLDHDDTYLRYEVVDKAHQDTFRWIIEDGPSVDSERLSQSRKLLRTWLSEEEGVFHVVGKLGSGKSTLMKFLFNHPNTLSDLRRCSGDRRLALVKFFFWRPGSIWQNSVKGLLRGLVHNTLQSCPELVPVAFPSIWEDAVVSSGHTLDRSSARSIDDDTIESAFSNILKHASVLQTHRLCFFIDALDEQNDSSPQNDHKALVETIQHWADSSQGALKVCVSSREDNVFTNAFRSDRRLRLQDLTRRDLEMYVREKLPIPSTKMRERITQTIVERSHGIFLWVVLVFKALREAFEDGRELDAFEAELNSLPTELEALFAHLLQTIPMSRRKNAYCLFKLMLLSAARGKLPVHAIMYLDKYLKNHRFALENDPSTSKAGHRPIPKNHLQEDLELVRARKMLHGDCRGLLESVVTTGEDAHHMTFTHRSVPEFLQRTSTQKIHHTGPSVSLSRDLLLPMSGALCVAFLLRGLPW
ncbi:hypothetical protein P171DRAFT_122106 [Karstenula rhodostoma CBS 690.94]|uniref:Nephrocystin 3-like N-terminal domain-containing protein n=1 Tax=Karstenula rhodostoma CBS 690.94 TaxID=1392251 RepID=A0A9P4P8X9_9PLEO|nr:hypothetical protein P171DRAFT_122106 [Karstenula rhodostoma CBS 690.94]